MSSSRERFLAAVLGDPDGRPWQRALYYASRIVIGGIVGFIIVAMATPRREGGQGFDLEIYLAATAGGAVLALGLAIVPRLLRPKHWPTREEFRRGGRPPEE